MEADCKHQNLALLLLKDGGGSMARNEGGLWKLSELGPQPTAREELGKPALQLQGTKCCSTWREMGNGLIPWPPEKSSASRHLDFGPVRP